MSDRELFPNDYYIESLDELREMRDSGKSFGLMGEYLDRRVYSLIENGYPESAMNLAKASKTIIYWY